MGEEGAATGAREPSGCSSRRCVGPSDTSEQLASRGGGGFKERLRESIGALAGRRCDGSRFLHLVGFGTCNEGTSPFASTGTSPDQLADKGCHPTVVADFGQSNFGQSIFGQSIFCVLLWLVLVWGGVVCCLFITCLCCCVLFCVVVCCVVVLLLLLCVWLLVLDSRGPGPPACPLRRTPLRRTPLRRTPLRRTPLRRTPLRRTAQNFALFFSLSRHSFSFFFPSLLAFR